jgi:hypothetical protein
MTPFSTSGHGSAGPGRPREIAAAYPELRYGMPDCYLASTWWGEPGM